MFTRSDTVPSHRSTANTRMRKFALYKQRSPIHQSRYSQLALTIHEVTVPATLGTLKLYTVTHLRKSDNFSQRKFS